MLDMKFKCKSVRQTSERGNKGGIGVDAACYPSTKAEPLPGHPCGVLHVVADPIARARALSSKPFTQLYLSAETPGPLAGSA
jgi:hypothetical protein